VIARQQRRGNIRKFKRIVPGPASRMVSFGCVFGRPPAGTLEGDCEMLHTLTPRTIGASSGEEGADVKKLILAGAGVLTLIAAAQPAAAADMPVKAPVLVPAWTWEGYYGGVNVGYSWGDWNSTCLFRTDCFPVTPGTVSGTGTGLTLGTGAAAALAFTAANTTGSASPNVDGWLGGIHYGRNWQRGNWVFGLDSDWDWTGERERRNGTVTFRFTTADATVVSATTTLTNEWKLNWFSNTRARLGLAHDTWLVYVAGGLAMGRFTYTHGSSVTVSATTVGGATTSASAIVALSERKTRLGYTVGGGVEKALSQNWIARAEYLYLDFGTRTFFEGVTIGGTRFDTNVRLRDHVGRVGISYLFNTAPIVARY
jgi:outer membrane immunogenic protein